MGRLSRSDAARVREIREEIGTVRLEAPTAVALVLPLVRELLGADCAALHCPKESEAGGGFVFCHVDNAPPEFLRRLAKLAAGPTQPFAQLTSPPPAERNRVVRAVAALTREVYERSELYLDVMRPSGLGAHEPLRVLICDGDALLAWFGVLSERPFSGRDHLVLAALAGAMRRRLSFDRMIESAPRKSNVLDAALELLCVPAFVVSAQGAVHESNAAGRALLAASRSVSRSLRDAVAGRPCPFDVQLLALGGGLGGWIATVRAAPDAARDRCAHATIRWSLTPRQAEVLACVVSGLANAAIASTLEIAMRTVEFHVTALFDRAGVETRSALVASLFTLR